MKRVADALGVTPIAIYCHVDNKSDLILGALENLQEAP